MRDTGNIEAGYIWDENILGGSGCTQFQLVGCGIVLKLLALCRIETASDLLILLFGKSNSLFRP